MYWVQEEPWNMGAWQFIDRHVLRPCRRRRTLTFVGSRRRGQSGDGSYKVHQAEEAELVTRALARA